MIPAATPPSRSRSACAPARTAAPPSPRGASTGEHEAIELRDGDERATSARASRRPSATSTARSPRRSPASTRPTRRALDGKLIELDGTDEQVAAGRERDPRRVAGDRARRGGGARPAAVALPRRRLGAHPARADDEHPQRRRARGQQRRLPGVHGRAGRRAELRGGAAHGRRGLPRAEGDAEEARPEHRGRRRGRLRAGPRVQRGGAAGADRGRSRPRATSPATTSRSRSTRPSARSSRTASTSSPARAARCSASELVDYWTDLADALPDPARSRTAWTRTTGTAGRRSPTRSATRSSSSATTCS